MVLNFQTFLTTLKGSSPTLQELHCGLFVGEQCATSFKLNELNNLASNWTLDHCLSC